MKYKFKRPNKNNVGVGDFLVIKNKSQEIKLAPIKDVFKDRVWAEWYDGGESKIYEKALILKKDGTYLVGKNCIERLLEDY